MSCSRSACAPPRTSLRRGGAARRRRRAASARGATAGTGCVRGSFLTAKHIVPHMMQAGRGRIINFASNAARTLSPLLGCSYTAAKTAILGLTRHLSREYAADGILVNTIAPGPVDGERVADL